MRKDFKNKMQFLPLPVLIIGTYDKEGKPNAMNAAWGSIYDFGKITISLGEHKTTENLKINKAFTVSFATKKTLKQSDYFGIVSGSKIDKITKVKFHAIKSKFVNAPIFDEYPITLECEVESFKEGTLIGKVLNTSVDKNYLTKDGKIDVDKLEIISFDMVNNSYRILGKKVGNAFSDGKKYK